MIYQSYFKEKYYRFLTCPYSKLEATYPLKYDHIHLSSLANLFIGEVQMGFTFYSYDLKYYDTYQIIKNSKKYSLEIKKIFNMLPSEIIDIILNNLLLI